MNVDTKLREAGKAVRDAHRGDFTVRSPSTRRRRINGPALAAATALLVIAAIGVPAFLASGPSSEPASSTADAAASPASQPNNETAPVTGADTFPYLGMELDDAVVYDAYDVTDDVTGEVIGAHIAYLQTWTHESGEDVGRVTELRVQRSDREYARFDELVAASTSSKVVQVGDREVTVYAIPDDATDECCYDLGVLRWVEAPGIEAIVIPWGLDADEALQLVDTIQTLDETAWYDTVESVVPTNVATTVVTSSADTMASLPADGD